MSLFRFFLARSYSVLEISGLFLVREHTHIHLRDVLCVISYIVRAGESSIDTGGDRLGEFLYTWFERCGPFPSWYHTI